MFEYVDKNKNTFGGGATDGKLAIVGHSMVFKVMTTSEQYWQMCETPDSEHH